MRYLILSPLESDHLSKARAGFEEHAIGPWIERAAISPGTPSIRVLTESPDSPSVAPKLPVHEDNQTLVFFDGVPLHQDFDAFDARQLMANWSHAGGCHGRYTLIRFDRNSGTLELRTDPVSLAPVYTARLPGGAWAITNIPKLAHQLAEASDLDPLGVAGLLTTDAPLADRTLIDSVRAVPNNATLTASASAPIAISTSDPMIAAGREPVAMSASDAASSFCGTFAPLLTRLESAGFDLRCAITGGRDSRACSALVAAALDRPQYHFGGAEGASESRIAAQVAEALGGSFTLKSDANEPNAENFAQAEQHLFDRDCGMNIYAVLRPAQEPPPDPGLHRELHITGHAGEIARWSFESLSGMLTPPSIKASRHRLRTRMINAGEGAFRPDTIARARAHVDSLIDTALDNAVTKTNLQTVVANQIKAPRWAAMQITRSAERRDLLVPFLSSAFFPLAMSIHPRERFADAFHTAMIRQNAPAALDIPYHGYPSTTKRLRNELAREAIGRVGALKRRYAKRKGPSRHARWEPWLRPILRDRVLALAPDSKAWDYLDRANLERVLTHESPEPFQHRVYEIMRAATFVHFLDWNRTLDRL